MGRRIGVCDSDVDFRAARLQMPMYQAALHSVSIHCLMVIVRKRSCFCFAKQ